MKLRRKVYLVGGAHTPYLGKGHPDFVPRAAEEAGGRRNPTLEEHLQRAVREAFAATGVDPGEVDRGYVGNFVGELFAQQGHLGAMLAAAHPALARKPFARVEAACASGGVAVVACVDALQGAADVALAVGVEVETNVPGKVAADYIARAGHYETEGRRHQHLFPHLFARRARAYKEAFGATDEDLGRVVVKAYANAARNPLAQMRTASMDLAHASTASSRNPTFLDDPELRPHLKLSDCSQLSDGASAVLLATEEGLARLGVGRERTTEILACGFSTSPLGAETDPTALPNAAHAAAEAYRDAGLAPPDMDVAELHDCFSISELQLCEAVGLCERGQAARLYRDGATQRGGRIPVNPGGGLIGFGHPVGATGVRMVFDVHRQVKGLGGEHQVGRRVRHGISANLGGDDRTAVVLIQRDAA